jgi:O-antigen/teichoic acid export membrane protein
VLFRSIASILSLSGRYIYRLVLGIFYSYSTVSLFFGATNIIDLCMAPMSILSQLLLSMLSGFSRLEDVGKRQRYTVLAAAVSIGVGGPLIVLLAGPFILSVIFPDFADESTHILRWLVMVVPCLTVESFSRPFVIKFGPIKFVPVLNFITLMGHLVPAITLIPKFGVMGAAVSYNIGYSLSAISWLGTLLWTFKFSHKYKSDVEVLCPMDGE